MSSRRASPSAKPIRRARAVLVRSAGRCARSRICADPGLRQRLEHIDRGPREQRAVHLERRVLGGRADEGDQAALDVRQEGVLLRLVEAVHLVDEEDGAAARAARARPAARLHRLADVLHAGEHRRERDELGVEGLRHQARERGLARAGRSPQDHRVRLAGLEREAQRLARARAGAAGRRPRRASAAAAPRRAAPRVRALPNRSFTDFAEDVGALRAARSGIGRVDLRVALELEEAQHACVWPKLSTSSIASQAVWPKPMRMRSKPASRSCGFASSHSSPSRVAGARRASNAFSTSLAPARSAAGVEPSAFDELAHRDLVQVAGRRSRRARRRRRSPGRRASRRPSGTCPAAGTRSCRCDSCDELAARGRRPSARSRRAPTCVLVEEALEALEAVARAPAGGKTARRRQRAEPGTRHACAALLRFRRGTRTSRLPLDCIAETMPARSMSSISRAARL